MSVFPVRSLGCFFPAISSAQPAHSMKTTQRCAARVRAFSLVAPFMDSQLPAPLRLYLPTSTKIRGFSPVLLSVLCSPHLCRAEARSAVARASLAARRRARCLRKTLVPLSLKADLVSATLHKAQVGPT